MRVEMKLACTVKEVQEIGLQLKGLLSLLH